MSRHIKGLSRSQATLFPEVLDDFISKENPVRVIDVFVDGLSLELLGFRSVKPKNTGRPGYHPATLLKIYIYGYLNRIQSSRCLERETQRNVEIIRGENTSEETIATVVAYAAKMGKSPIVVNDCPGFFINRVLFPYFGGFAKLISDGADFVKVDKVMEK